MSVCLLHCIVKAKHSSKGRVSGIRRARPPDLTLLFCSLCASCAGSFVISFPGFWVSSVTTIINDGVQRTGLRTGG